jgi:hypothetical protein
MAKARRSSLDGLLREVLPMQQMCRSFLRFSAVVCLFALLAYGQDALSMGEVARQARQQKQNQDAKSKLTLTSTTPKVITNDEIPEHPEAAEEPTTSEGEIHAGTSSSSASDGAKMSAEQWKSLIRAQKDAVSSLQSGIEKLNASIQFAPGNCVAGCVQWNERQKQKQQEVERARTQLESQKKRLESMQESARKQGYGSSVYDP